MKKFIRRILMGGLTLAIVGGGLTLGYKYMEAKSVITVVNQVETKEVTVDALDKRIADALTASSTDIEVKAKKAYDDAKHQAEVDITLSVTAKYRGELQKKEEVLQKESKTY